jgi:tetratricopeptide (TPR) repeat protein
MPESFSPRTVFLLRLTTPLIVFAAVAAALALVNGSCSGGSEASSIVDLSGAPVIAADGQDPEPAARGTEGMITALQQALREDPDDEAAYAALGDAYYQRARETGDAAYYSRAEGAFQEALARNPEDIVATAGLGTLALARHDFAAALELGRQAYRLEPRLFRAYPVIVDAQIELGRYRAASETLERLVRLKPTLAAYSRVSYYRELHGDLTGAVRAMRLAVSAGSGSVEASAYVLTLLGGLEVARGRYDAADHAYDEALALDPGYPPALAGRARIEAGRGRFDAAILTYRRVVERLPLPEYAIALAETEQAAGAMDAARRDFALVEAQARLLGAQGVNTDVELALYEADHGDPRRGVVLGQDAWRRAPSVRSADAYSWALFRAGRLDAASKFSRRAMRLGSRDPSFLYHAGIIARATGRNGAARDYLGTLVRQSPRFHPLYGPRAQRALEGLR